MRSKNPRYREAPGLKTKALAAVRREGSKLLHYFYYLVMR
jgi:hypothetical protein